MVDDYDDDHYQVNKEAEEVAMTCAGTSMHLIVSHNITGRAILSGFCIYEFGGGLQFL